MHVECGSASSAHGVALYQTHTEDGLNIKPGDRLEHTRTHADDAVVPSGPSYRHTDTHTHTHRDYRSSLESSSPELVFLAVISQIPDRRPPVRNYHGRVVAINGVKSK